MAKKMGCDICGKPTVHKRGMITDENDLNRVAALCLNCIRDIKNSRAEYIFTSNKAFDNWAKRHKKLANEARQAYTPIAVCNKEWEDGEEMIIPKPDCKYLIMHLGDLNEKRNS